MKKVIPMVIHDKIIVPFSDKEQSIQFFIDRKQNAKSIIKTNEKEIIEEIFNEDGNIVIFCNELGLVNNIFYGLEIIEPIKKNEINKPGDFDVILFEKDKIHLSVALQVKKIGIIIKQNEEKKLDFINHIDYVENLIIDGLEQTYRQLKHYLFYRNYFVLILEIDARQQKDVNVIFRDISNDTYHIIRKIISDIENNNQDYDKSIGIILIPFIQNNDMPYKDAGKVLIDIDRECVTLKRPDETTNRIKDAFKRKLFKELYVQNFKFTKS